MNGCDQPEFVSSNIEDGQPIHLIRRRKGRP
jgi:hypothetical protein